MTTWTDLDRVVQQARDAANRHDSPSALTAIDAALEMLADILPPDRADLRRVVPILQQGLANARDGVWAMLYDQAFLDLDLIHALPAALASGAIAALPMESYLGQALEPFKGRMQRAM